MEFYTSFSEKRPVRLSEATRLFAYNSLYSHKYGLLARETPSVNVVSDDEFSGLSLVKKYDRLVREIVLKAPVRVCEGERISLSASFGDAIDHWLPAKVNGEHIFLGISHLTMSFEKVISVGIGGIKKEAEEALESCSNDKREFLLSCISTIESFKIWIDRYIEKLSSTDGFEENAKILTKVPFAPPSNFREAVQAMWAAFAFTRLCGCWPGIGRIDMLLGKYLEKDLENGIITINEAREILAHFFIKGCEWITGDAVESGDAQHYQNIVLGGCDENGKSVTNEVSYLVLDIVEELGISDFPVSVRIGNSTPEKLVRRACEVMRYGNGVIAVYNEETVIKALQSNGYSLFEARRFANDGCWEVMLPGQTYFTYVPFDSLALLQKKTLRGYSAECTFSSFEELYKSYIDDLKAEAEAIHDLCKDKIKKRGKLSYAWNESVPCTVISLFVDDCIKKGLSYTDGGALYTVYSPHLGGLADTANSLYALKKLVWDEKKVSLQDFMTILSKNWEGYDELRQYAQKLEYYGNDNDEADSIVKSILSDFADICASLEERDSFRFPAGVSTFGRQIDWSEGRYALPCGQRAKSVLANNMAPTPETALKGPTAIINSYCKADLSRISNGAALDIRLLPSDVKGETGLNALCGIVRAFCHLGGFFMQIDVADSKILRDAQKNPDSYPALAVRIAGWNARFVTLSRQWQDMIISNIEKKDGN